MCRHPARIGVTGPTSRVKDPLPAPAEELPGDRLRAEGSVEPVNWQIFSPDEKAFSTAHNSEKKFDENWRKVQKSALWIKKGSDGHKESARPPTLGPHYHLVVTCPLFIETFGISAPARRTFIQRTFIVDNAYSQLTVTFTGIVCIERGSVSKKKNSCNAKANVVTVASK